LVALQIRRPGRSNELCLFCPQPVGGGFLHLFDIT